MMSSRPSFQLADQLRQQRLVARRQRAHGHHVNVVLHRLPRGLGGSLKERSDVDVEAHVGERRGDHLGAAVVTVLAQLGDHDARTPTLAVRRTHRLSPRPLETRPGQPNSASIDARDRADHRRVAAEGLLHGKRDLA
jgi:hypothetical protein